MGTHVVIGGSSGIGAATARRLRQSGGRVHLIGRNEARLRAVADEVGGSLSVADVQDKGALEKAVAAAGDKLDGLCYAAGTINLKPVPRVSDDDARRDFEVNALGALRAVQAALPALKASEGTGSIVLFSTIAVAQGFTAHASVAMAKGAVEGLTLALAAEFAPKIRVNCIAPSLTRTPLAASLTSNETMASAIAALHPLQRLGEADDIAALAAFLLGPDSSWITGQIIGVDGGRSSLRTKG
ncbi:MAG: SDR family NAD(P)-dependent oxidoreductase [Aestuariivirga sp.]